MNNRENNIKKILKGKKYPLSSSELKNLSEKTGYSQGDIEYTFQKMNKDLQYNKKYKNGGGVELFDEISEYVKKIKENRKAKGLGEMTQKEHSDLMNELQKKFNSKYAKGSTVKGDSEEYAEIKLVKGKYLICLPQWNRLVKRGILKSDDNKNAKDWRPAKKSTNCKWADMGSPYDERYMYSPLYDQLRYQDEGEWYSYGSVSDTFANGGNTTSGFNYTIGGL